MAINRNDRAKQFRSFDALSGLYEALREKEKEIECVEKIILDDEILEEISRQFVKIQKGSKIETTYYINKEYKTKIAYVLKIDYIKKAIILDDETKVFFDDILKLEIKD